MVRQRGLLLDLAPIEQRRPELTLTVECRLIEEVRGFLIRRGAEVDQAFPLDAIFGELEDGDIGGAATA